jgi:hypothetical protein
MSAAPFLLRGFELLMEGIEGTPALVFIGCTRAPGGETELQEIGIVHRGGANAPEESLRCCYLPEANFEAAKLVAHRICDSVASDGKVPKLFISVGIAVYPQPVIQLRVCCMKQTQDFTP